MNKIKKSFNLFSKTNRRWLTTLMVIVLTLQFFLFFPHPTTSAATITLYPNAYTYVKAAPYWTCSPFDEFSTAQQVKIIERDYDYFYIEYTKSGEVRRGYAPITSFNASDYAGYVWCDHPDFTPGYNNTTTSKTTYYTSTGSVASGSIDSDEGSHPDKPILVLRYEGSRAFIQYVTNPGEAGQVKYKRAWVDSSCITRTPPSSVPFGNTYTLIKNRASGKYLQVTYTSAGYSISEGVPTGYISQQWQIIPYYTANGGYYYKIKNAMSNTVLVVEDLIPVVGNKIELMEENEPNKGQHFAFEESSGNSFKILTRSSGNYLAVHFSDGVIRQEKPSTSTAQEWIFEPLNKYWQLSYSNLSYSNGKAVIPYYIDTSSSTGISNAELTVTNVTNAESAWNNVNANVTLTRTTQKSSAKIIIQTKDLEDEVLGETQPNTEFLNYTWSYATVYINSSRISSSNQVIGLSAADKEMLLCHEFGHALKIMHPYGEGHTSENHVVYSVMNQGLPSRYEKVRNIPTQYDIRTFKNKWGG